MIVNFFERFSSPPTLSSLQTNGPSEPSVSAGNIVIQSKTGTVPTNTLQLVMDPRLGLIVGTMTPTSGNAAPVVPITTAQKPSQPVTVSPQIRQMTPQPRKRGRPSLVPANNPPPLQQIQQLQMQQNTRTWILFVSSEYLINFIVGYICTPHFWIGVCCML